MPGRIPPKFIDELLARVDIVELIDGYVPLKKKGREYVACCPFHGEKTPSFTVSPQKQFYHCFGCGVHGTAIGFLMEYDHLNYVEAIETLAHSLNLEVPREGGSVLVNHTSDDYELYNAHPLHVEFVQTRWIHEVTDFMEIDYRAYTDN